MTLLLASAGFVAQYPEAAQWFLSEQAERISHRNPSSRARPSSTRVQEIPWTWIAAAMTTALVAAALAFVSISGRGGGPASETRGLPETLQSQPAGEDHLASTLVAYPDAKAEAKAMLGDDPVALPDFIGTLPPRLDHTMELALPGPSLEKTSAPYGQKKQVRRTESRLARVTVYWPEEGDFYTRNRQSSTGVRLRDGVCAVDPEVIPYGSVVHVPSIGPLLAVDTGSAVISRRAARNAARTPEQRKAIVIDVFCSSRSKAKALIKRIEHFAVVTWQPPKRSAEL